MNHHIYRDPLKAIGNAEDNRVDDPDEPVASLVGLNRGILAAIQGAPPGGGGGGTVGGATAANQVTGNASLASIDAKMNTPLPAGTNNIGSVGTAADVTLTPVDPAAATATKGQLIAAQFNTALPTFTDGQQGSLQVNGNGQLLVTSSTSSTGLAKAEDGVHGSGHVGIMALGVRKDTAATTVDADGDYAPLLTDAQGRLWVHVGASDVAGGGGGDATAANQVTGNASLTSIDTKVGSATPAGTNLMGKVSVGADTSTIYSGTTVLTPKFAVIDHAVSGDNTIVPVVASKKIRVLSLFLIAAGAVNVRFESGASGTALTGQMNLPTNGGFVLPYNPIGWFETAAGALLNLELSAAVSVDGSLAYVEV